MTIADSGRIRLACISAALISVLVASMFVTGAIVSPAKAQSDPIILWIVTTTNEGPGYYGGYHDIVRKLQIEFAKIGIDLRWAQYEPYTWEKIVWEDQWNLNGSADGNPASHQQGKDGWDLTIFEWWANPSSYIWLDEQVYSWATPPTGWNIESYNDTRMDELWQAAQATLDPVAHKTYLDKWQAQWMHNPEAIPIYYPETYTGRASYVDNYDETSWLYDLSQFDINEAKFAEVMTDPKFSARNAIGDDTLLYAIAEPIWNFFTLITWTYTEEAMNVLKTSTLYRNSRENLAYPSSGDFIIEPNLATKIPDATDWRTITEGGKEKWVVRIPIKQGLYWTDNGIGGVEQRFNATDVAFTYNTILSLPDATAYGDFSFLLDRVQVVDEYTVDFIYKPGMGPDYDFAGYNAHGWGLSMLPEHQLRGFDMSQWRTAPWNKDPVPDSADGHMGGGSTNGLECLGPYVPIAWKTPYEWIKYQLRPEFVSTMGWADTLPQYWYQSYIPDDAVRMAALQNLEVDMVEYPTAPVAAWEGMMGWPSHRISTYNYPASHPLWIQHRNTILSNRYVRLAMAYAIPYQDIYTQILPGWGVKTALPGKTFVTPWHDAFNSVLGNYVYNITKAQMYMNLYRNSTVGGDPALGPSGDHNFSGLVDMIDYPIWVSNLGKFTYQFPWWPSTPVDPDNTNNGQCDGYDFPGWADNFGRYYPFREPW